MSESTIGSSFEDFLEAEGIRDEVHTLAQKRRFVWQIEQAMQASGITKVEMAERMNTSRSKLERLLDPDDDRVQLDTLQRAARAVGRSLRLELA